jgi:dihydrofolate reductase
VKISLIVAMSENRVIGVENRLPWHIPEDLQRFKAITSGHPIIMGRKTFDSIGRPLPKRTNLVVTRNRDWRAESVLACGSLPEALDWASRSPGSDEVFVIGGGEIFREALPLAHRIYLTEVQWPFEGDAFFPAFDEAAYHEVKRESLSDSPPACLRVLDRAGPAPQPWEL